MRARAIALAVLAMLAATGAAGAADPRVVFVQRSLVRDYDPSLPIETLATWLKRVLPKGGAMRWTTTTCGARVDDPEPVSGEADVPCVAAVMTSRSRDRVVELHFEPTGRLFVTSFVDSPDGELFAPPKQLDQVANVFDRELALEPIACPAGTEPFLLDQNGATFEGCARAGVIDGFYRSWFRYAVQLMERGRFVNGTRVGRWTQCDGAGRCQEVAY
ncbi:MAG: hypothetical protein WD673_11320 [Alphaproteobacteria bacterium]